MSIRTIGGPWTKAQADDTASALGRQYSVYGKERTDAEGFGTGEYDYFVEMDDSIQPDRIFGYKPEDLLAKQRRR